MDTTRIALARTRDMNVVREVLAHPAIWPHIHEDRTDEPEPHDLDGFHWLLVTAGGDVAGVFLAHARGEACWEVHTCLLPSIWGKGSAAAAQLLLAHLFGELGCAKVVTNVPAYNRPALRFAKTFGQVEGINRSSFLRNGILEDQIMLGITRKEWTCQQQSQQQQP